MKYLLLISLSALTLNANIYQLTAAKHLVSNGSVFSAKHYYRDYCDNGYVWRLYGSHYRGSYTQVFEKVPIATNRTGFNYTSVPKTCN